MAKTQVIEPSQIESIYNTHLRPMLRAQFFLDLGMSVNAIFFYPIAHTGI